MCKPGNRILHVLAKPEDWPDGTSWSDDNQKLRQFLDWILESHHDLLENKNEYNYTPLHLAPMHRHTVFVDAVLQNRKLMNLGKVLSEACPHGNSLHLAIKHRLDIDLIKLMVDKCAQMIAQDQGADGNTPLHACMSMDIDREESEAESESDEGDEDDQDRETEAAEEQDHVQDAKNLGWIPVDTGTVKRKPTHVELKSPTTTQRRPSHTLPLQQLSIMVPAAREDVSYSVRRVVELLVQKHDSVLTSYNTENRTPYQERIHQLQLLDHVGAELTKAEQAAPDDEKAAAREAAVRRIVSKDPVASYIRSYCVRNFPRDKIMTCLSHPGQGTFLHSCQAAFLLRAIQNNILNSTWEGCRIRPSPKTILIDYQSICDSRAFSNMWRCPDSQ